MRGKAILNLSDHIPDPDATPCFAEPWQARAFALTVSLHRAGVFDWPEWTETLGAALAKAGGQGDPHSDAGYYDCWLSALEQMLVARGVAETGLLDDLRQAWDRAARATPHGQPIVLGANIATS